MPTDDRHPLAGRFVAFDGGEGCGKSTQIHKLRDALTPELAVEMIRDPGSTFVGERVRHLLLDPESEMGMRCEMLLYTAARAQLVEETIGPALEAGHLVLSDRFVSSTLAYQLGGDGLTADEIEAVGRIATAGRMPDLTIILDVPTDVAQARVVPKFVAMFEDADAPGDKDRIERRPAEYHRRVRENFLAQACRHPECYAVVDAARSIDEVASDVRSLVRERLGG